MKEQLIKLRDKINEVLEKESVIRYMNGNDGTHFDWKENNRLCEFEVFNENKNCILKTFVNCNSKVEFYLYKDEDILPFKEIIENEFFTREEVKELKDGFIEIEFATTEYNFDIENIIKFEK